MPHFKRAAVYEEQKRTGKWGQLVEETKDRIPEYSNKTIAKISHLDNGCLWPEIKVSFSHHLSILQSMCLHFIISILFSKYIFVFLFAFLLPSAFPLFILHSTLFRKPCLSIIGFLKTKV
ncbi:uncharacterized protein YOR015W [Saccharomyces cerevisiae S288C]|uniref:Uncharacterized protein YOR015W n=1 Tax=Saccharomyces cerevisiae (strain ATCC 204508 / S288c) TaxID=559292 RepID=YO015_YEAST|eukprot:NP_001335814.1 hypothetical protein YOR015W [Saccharomyces cerevisiae S288C]